MPDPDQLLEEYEEDPAQADPPGEYGVIALLFVIVAILFAGSLALPGIFQGHTNDAGTLPQIATFLALVLLGIEFAKLLVKRQPAGGLRQIARYLFSKEVFILIGAVVCYALLLELLHFELTTALFLWGCMFLLDRKRPIHKLIVTGCTVGGIVLVFSTVFNVMLP